LLLPAAIAYSGKLIVDTVVFFSPVWTNVLALGYLGQRRDRQLVRQPATICQSPLRMLLGQRVNILMEKALTLISLTSRTQNFTTR